MSKQEAYQIGHPRTPENFPDSSTLRLAGNFGFYLARPLSVALSQPALQAALLTMLAGSLAFARHSL